MKNPRNLVIKLKFIGISALFALILAACSPEPTTAAPVAATTDDAAESLPEAKDFTVQRVGGNSEKVKLSDLKGKVVLIDFWATWCGPCKIIMPAVDEMYKKHKDNGFEVLAVSSEAESVLKNYVAKTEYSYPIYADFAGLAEGTYQVNAIPMSILVNREGKIVYQNLGADPDGLVAAVEKAMQ